jgi:hypothetical protein
MLLYDVFYISKHTVGEHVLHLARTEPSDIEKRRQQEQLLPPDDGKIVRNGSIGCILNFFDKTTILECGNALLQAFRLFSVYTRL